MTDPRPAAVIVLAAGQGTRMKSRTAKVLHRMCGRTLLGHVLAAVAETGAARTLVVVGRDRDAVVAHLGEVAPQAVPVSQEPQQGTGQAARMALAAVPDLVGPVIVVPADTPLLTGASLRRLATHHAERAAAATVLTARLPDPTGYGRIVRGPGGDLERIVEERDANDATRRLDEVATSIYAFDAESLRALLGELGRDNAQGEEYLTDAVGMLVDAGRPVETVDVGDHREILGINDQLQLAVARRTMRDRLLERWMLEGVTVTDPQTTWLGVGVSLAPDVTIHQNTQLHGTTRIESGAVVGPNCTLTDTVVGAGATVANATCNGAEIGPDASVGPYTYLRPGTRLGRAAKAGGFVEVKASTIGENSKVPHLSYVGDATIGDRTNIGAATVFVNYDGQRKHRTEVGDDVRVGSDSMLVAPVRIGDGAYTAAGSVITGDVPPGALAVARARQRNIEGWVGRARGGAAVDAPAVADDDGDGDVAPPSDEGADA
ncbi:MAG TPA: bifunctional UDP-N-acetylglucosamine diphosphorylase/glucosamine-1-phosphate N-acetyltransferase GlmU [Mycobacteriales bacterium]|nr:bifunctional UDP-N-acetylglucosamine diphosphorylase/glucosamine-1-phosphate N-acetyltransferase GlmU [Mycobacteriales bacterium]